MLDLIAKINGMINSVVWGLPLLALLVGTGIYLTVRTHAVQIRKFGFAMKNTLGKIFQKDSAGQGEVTPFQAVTTALAATVGTGNVSGVIAAVTLGGPGAIFWLWVTAIFGMCTKFAEALLAVKYRERNKEGDWVGGPMYYIKNGLGKKWRWLAVLFCIFGSFAAFGTGNAVQVSNIVDAVNNAIVAVNPSFSNFGTSSLIVSICIALVAGFTLIGGIKRLGKVTEKIVPIMSLIYIISCLTVIFCNIRYIGTVFGWIFKYAFTANAIIGGTVGAAIKTCITWGVKRGVFSNEAGLGSAPIAHAGTSETNPVKQGLYGIFEVFIDTIVICSLTGITILIARAAGSIDWEYGVQGTNVLISDAFGTIFGQKLGAIFIAIAIALFALSTCLSWGLYGGRCFEYLCGTHKVVLPYYAVYVIAIVVVSKLSFSLAWDIADTFNGLMAIPNLIAIVALSGVITKITREFFADKKNLAKKK